jgi:hypothetical protein
MYCNAGDSEDTEDHKQQNMEFIEYFFNFFAVSYAHDGKYIHKVNFKLNHHCSVNMATESLTLEEMAGAKPTSL